MREPLSERLYSQYTVSSFTRIAADRRLISPRRRPACRPQHYRARRRLSSGELRPWRGDRSLLRVDEPRGE
ncbi:hypothetical protein PUN28_004803 [Cardiocondyla obscurior]|uniref:Uncharacterized protein n=1 Tax=Cardiocondyla obscurior TaxID=286306 RepID=A0AAW2GFD8_9HYME